jgi:hypothetical protein
MPNWCNNNIEITGPKNKLEELSKACGEGLFNHILPIPEELSGTQSPARDEDKKKNKALKEKHGYDNWYDWNVNNWGTKWDCSGEDSFYQNEIKDGDTDFHGKLCLAFDTAWAPPIGIYEELIRKDFGVKAFYYEPGMDFAGLWEDGNDDCITVHDHKHDDSFWDDGLGAKLDDNFNICEEMAQYDEDEEEVENDKKKEVV